MTPSTLSNPLTGLITSPPRQHERSSRRCLFSAALLGVALLSASGCTLHSPLKAVQGVAPHSGWAEITGSRTADLGAGITLEMPSAPYRARYADAQGIYYQASLPLIYRSALGTTTAATGGLYVRHGEPARARSWSEPIMPSPSMAHSHWFAVRVHQAP